MAAAPRLHCETCVPLDWRHVWPCGTLAGGDRIEAETDARGDLCGLDVSRDGRPVDTSALECAELDAALEAAA